MDKDFTEPEEDFIFNDITPDSFNPRNEDINYPSEHITNEELYLNGKFLHSYLYLIWNYGYNLVFNGVNSEFDTLTVT